MKPTTALAAAAIAASLALPSRALAEDARPLAAAAERPAPQPRPGPEIGLSFGLRGMLVPSAGLDPYSYHDVLLQTSVAGSITFLRVGAASFVASGEWNFGARSATARGNKASLAVHRIAGALETRYAVASRLTLFAKVAPSALHLRGDIAAPTLGRSLVARPWTWGLDTTGGGALLLGRTGDPRAPSSRWWLTAEAGYAFAGAAEMHFTPVSDSDDPRRFGAVALPTLRLAGPVLRTAIAVTF